MSLFNISKLPLPDKIAKGQQIITMSTVDPNVPENTAVVTALTTCRRT